MGRKLKSVSCSAALASGLGLQLAGSDLSLAGVSDLAGAQANDLCFIKSEKLIDAVKANTVVVTTATLASQVIEAGSCAIVSLNPRLDFARAMAWLDQEHGFSWSEEGPTIDPTAKVGANVVIGRGVCIGPYTVIMNNVVIGDEVKIGARCVVKSCAVIGEEGFGFERDAEGRAVRLPHIGGVVIEDDVEVGSLTTVCRGTLGDTVVLTGAKIDDHVHIAHNVVVGAHAFVIACAEVSGGVVIGTGAWLAPCVTVKNQVRIGDRAVIGLGAVVLKDVDADQVIVGNPGKPLQR